MAIRRIGPDRHHRSSTTRPGRARSMFWARKTSTPTSTTPRSIAHEWGHYYQSAFSRDDSPGGGHSGGRPARSPGGVLRGLGQRLVRHRAGTQQLHRFGGAGQSARDTDRSERRARSGNPGWFREPSIQSILWNLNQQVGFQPIHAAMTGPLQDGVAVTSIHPFARPSVRPSPATRPTLDGLLSGQNISTAANDPFGALETNDGGVRRTRLPMYIPANLGGSTIRPASPTRPAPSTSSAATPTCASRLPAAGSHT